MAQLTFLPITDSHRGALAYTVYFATPPRCDQGIGDNVRHSLGYRNSPHRDRRQRNDVHVRCKGVSVFVLKVMLLERVGPFCSPSSVSEESRFGGVVESQLA